MKTVDFSMAASAFTISAMRVASSAKTVLVHKRVLERMVVAINADVLKDAFVVEKNHLVCVGARGLQARTQGSVLGFEKSDALVNITGCNRFGVICRRLDRPRRPFGGSAAGHAAVRAIAFCDP